MISDNSPKLSIITPSFKEAPNIPILVKEIFCSLETVIPEWELIIVDDNSEDGIVSVCESLHKKRLPIKLIVRKNKQGLATAVLEGFKEAKAPVFVVMDADLSHPPAAIPLLYQAIQNGADFAVGSRYIAGGGTDDRWTVYRYLNSKIASFLARPLITVSDPMSGFFSLPRKLLSRCKCLSPIGYKIGLEIIAKCKPQNLIEVPIHFRTRNLGKSKLTIKQQILYLYHLYSLYRFKLTVDKNQTDMP